MSFATAQNLDCLKKFMDNLNIEAEEKRAASWAALKASVINQIKELFTVQELY
jgi:hypothetical protein